MDPTVELATDGFPLDPADPDIRFHRELSAWLELEKPDRGPVALRFDPPAERSRWLRPALRRFAWVRSHGELIAGNRRLDFRIAHLISLLVNRMYPPDTGVVEEIFCELALQAAAIEESGAGSMFRADTARLLLDLVKAGIRPATRQNLHTMLRALPPDDRHARMPELAWHLFLDFEDPDDGEPCLSARIRRELRELKPAKRKPWISLLKLAPIRNAPDAKWEQKVRQTLDRIGRDDWERRVASWSELLQSAGPSALERPGQILLRLTSEIRRVAESPEPQPQIPDAQEILKLLREGSHTGFERAVEYTKQHGYQIETVEAVRQYHDTLHGSVTDQARRQHVGWWLWLEDVTPIKTEECWSSIVRADLRGFTGERKKAWLELIGNMTFAVVAKPPAKWTKVAEAALAAVGPEDFRNQMRRWLKPMDEDQPLRLTTPGRDVLRCLIWDASLCRPDPELDEALSWIGKATWKNKESRDRLSKIAGPLNDVLSASHPEGVMTVDKPVPKPYDPQAAMDKAMSQVLKSQPLGDRIEIHPDHILVRGERDHYRIAMDGVITRRSGRKVRVNMDELPNYITQLVRPAIDALDLEQGMFQPNPMRLFSLATILAHDAQWESAIE
ncbi:MAG TPA: hypothetical protein VGQ49_09545 [Bryobacteraceae bacterium]|jgi:hypothetical protein|nr:hypothetical protein [Bryobacteraceae bacterium]